MDGYDERTYGDRCAEVYDHWYGDDGGMALTRIGTPTTWPTESPRSPGPDRYWS